jgi:activator of HSP90 ATPase
MSESIEVSAVLPSSPTRIYYAWLSSDEHAAMTGEDAQIDPRVGGHYSTAGDYIQATFTELERPNRIVQLWRTTEFPADAPDSRLEVLLEEIEGGTKITVRQSDIPDGQGEAYEKGWVEFYFEPMKSYFSEETDV